MDHRPCNKTEIAERFTTLRRQSRLTQAELGHFIGVCRQSISEIENARVMPHETTWSKFCESERGATKPGIEHLPEGYWRDCLIEDEQAQKGDTLCASP